MKIGRKLKMTLKSVNKSLPNQLNATLENSFPTFLSSLNQSLDKIKKDIDEKEGLKKQQDLKKDIKKLKSFLKLKSLSHIKACIIKQAILFY